MRLWIRKNCEYTAVVKKYHVKPEDEYKWLNTAGNNLVFVDMYGYFGLKFCCEVVKNGRAL